MTSADKHRHPKLARPSLGNFGRNEWAILGTTCGTIQQLAGKLVQVLSPAYACAYADTSHNAGEMPGGMTGNGAICEYTDLLHNRQLVFRENPGVYQQRSVLNQADVVFVNGNHHEAIRQIVIVDPNKEASLQKRLVQLTNPDLVLLTEGTSAPFPWLIDLLSDREVPILQLNDIPGITAVIRKLLEQRKPRLKGLVLAGGRSSRMGTDKGSINWHGLPQREYAATLLSEFCEEVYISCRPDQALDQAPCPAIPDSFTDLGPYGAILSAFRHDPTAAWLVLACDLPLFDKAAVDELVSVRSPRSVATALRLNSESFPEPLVAIWEPKSYQLLLAFLGQGVSCPRKVLINSDVFLKDASRPEVLINVNSREEAEEIRTKYPDLCSAG